jgi:hypothetical protein
MDKDERQVCTEAISELLSCSDPSVLSSALFAFKEVCPDEFSLLHPHFRKICHLLADLDEWGQLVALDILLRYGRNQFKSPFRPAKAKAQSASDGTVIDASSSTSSAASVQTSAAGTSAGSETGSVLSAGKSSTQPPKKRKEARGFYSDSEDSDDASKNKQVPVNERQDLDDIDFDNDTKPSKSKNNIGSTGNVANGGGDHDDDGDDDDSSKLSPDHKLLLESVASLQYSFNSGVVMGFAAIFYHLAPVEQLAVVAQPLVRSLRNTRSVNRTIHHCSLSSLRSTLSLCPFMFSIQALLLCWSCVFVAVLERRAAVFIC